MPTIQTAAQAIEALANLVGHNPIRAAVLEWTRETFEYETNATAEDVLRHLETTDCAATHAPRGLIYTGDIAAKVPEWFDVIDDAMDEYRDATGEHAAPRDGAITIGWMVWFAVEWNAGEMAGGLRDLIQP